jgi:uncharacterized protein (TIGR00730 family)
MINLAKFIFFKKYKKLTPEERAVLKDEKKDIVLIAEEFKRGFDFIRQYPKSVSFFGSARSLPENEHYKEVVALSYKIVKELGYTIVTGGGQGIMEAANKGAHEARGDSIGLTIKLSTEQSLNKYVNKHSNFSYFFIRKTMLTFAAEAYIFCPGGFGTLDEFFDILTLVQTKKIPQIPIILFGKDYWQPLNHFIKEQVLKKHGAIDEIDMDLYKITDNHEEIIEIIKKTPITNWWKGFER